LAARLAQLAIDTDKKFYNKYAPQPALESVFEA